MRLTFSSLIFLGVLGECWCRPNPEPAAWEAAVAVNQQGLERDRNRAMAWSRTFRSPERAGPGPLAGLEVSWGWEHLRQTVGREPCNLTARTS